MSDEPETYEDQYEQAEVVEPQYADEAARLKSISEAEDVEYRREALLDRIAIARSRLYEAEAAGDAASAASIRETIKNLTAERNGL